MPTVALAGDAASNAKAEAAHERLSAAPDLRMHGSEQIVMLLYPEFTALDFVGPHFFRAGMMGAKVHLVTNQATLAPVVSDAGLAITPTVRMADCPEELDVLFTPGGSRGTIRAMQDAATRKFMAARGESQALDLNQICGGKPSCSRQFTVRCGVRSRIITVARAPRRTPLAASPDSESPSPHSPGSIRRTSRRIPCS